MWEGVAHIASSLAFNKIEVLSLLQCGIIDDNNFGEIVRSFSKSRRLSSVNLARNTSVKLAAKYEHNLTLNNSVNLHSIHMTFLEGPNLVWGFCYYQ